MQSKEAKAVYSKLMDAIKDKKLQNMYLDNVQ